jgi:hypothetical protein
VLATALSFLETTVESLTRPSAYVHVFDIARILNYDIVVAHDEVRLAMRVVRVFIIIVVVVAH